MNMQKIIRMLQATGEGAGAAMDASPDSCAFPVDVLAGYVGQNLELHYVDAGRPQIETARLMSIPAGHFFYMSYDGINQHIVYWHVRHADGRISGVKRILHEGHTVYENDDLPFDQPAASRTHIMRVSRGPSRTMTREYLSGLFG